MTLVAAAVKLSLPTRPFFPPSTWLIDVDSLLQMRLALTGGEVERGRWEVQGDEGKEEEKRSEVRVERRRKEIGKGRYFCR